MAFNRIVDNRNHDINRGPYRPLLRRVRCFAHQILKSNQRLYGTIRVNRRYPARVSRVPCLE